MIDLDAWASAYVKVRLRAQDRGRRSATRWGSWPVVAVAVLVILATASSSIELALSLLVWLALIVIGARLWNRGAARRLARKLRAIPAASEPFTFTADRTGTHSVAESGSDHLAWSRYREALVVDDLYALVLDTDVVRFLPRPALASDQSPAEVVATLTAWISADAPETQPRR